jgi:hypothetical protein
MWRRTLMTTSVLMKLSNGIIVRKNVGGPDNTSEEYQKYRFNMAVGKFSIKLKKYFNFMLVIAEFKLLFKLIREAKNDPNNYPIVQEIYNRIRNFEIDENKDPDMNTVKFHIYLPVAESDVAGLTVKKNIQTETHFDFYLNSLSGGFKQLILSSKYEELTSSVFKTHRDIFDIGSEKAVLDELDKIRRNIMYVPEIEVNNIPYNPDKKIIKDNYRSMLIIFYYNFFKFFIKNPQIDIDTEERFDDCISRTLRTQRNITLKQFKFIEEHFSRDYDSEEKNKFFAYSDIMWSSPPANFSQVMESISYNFFQTYHLKIKYKLLIKNNLRLALGYRNEISDE